MSKLFAGVIIFLSAIIANADVISVPQKVAVIIFGRCDLNGGIIPGDNEGAPTRDQLGGVTGKYSRAATCSKVNRIGTYSIPPIGTVATLLHDSVALGLKGLQVVPARDRL